MIFFKGKYENDKMVVTYVRCDLFALSQRIDDPKREPVIAIYMRKHFAIIYRVASISEFMKPFDSGELVLNDENLNARFRQAINEWQPASNKQRTKRTKSK